MMEFDEEQWKINIIEGKVLSNFLIPILLLIGGLAAFNSVGFSPLHAINKDQLPVFGPQTFSLILYGSASLVLGGFLLFFIKSTGGYIQFEKTSQQIILTYNNQIGEFQPLFFSYNFQELDCVKILYKERPYRKQSILLIFKDNKEIEIWSTDNPARFKEAESFIINLTMEMQFALEVTQQKN